jgi:hypothetical protein
MVVLWEQGFARRNSPPQLTRFYDRGSFDRQEAVMKFYDCVTAPSPRRVRIFLAEKGLTVPTVQVDLRNGEQFTPTDLS